MNTLPIFEIKDRFLTACLEAHRRVLLTAPTGSGKSMQIPQFLLDSGVLGDGKIVILQLWRLAARVAAERGTLLGGEVGYQIRLESRSSAVTRIEFVTGGILLRRILSDPALSGVSAILFDEFHERHAYGDVTLARAILDARTAHPDATLADLFAPLTMPPDLLAAHRANDRAVLAAYEKEAPNPRGLKPHFFSSSGSFRVVLPNLNHAMGQVSVENRGKVPDESHETENETARTVENGPSGNGASQSATDALRIALEVALENTGKSADAGVLEKILAVYRAMAENPRASLSAIARTLDASERSIDEYVAVLKRANAVRRKDGKRFGAWEILM